MLEHLVCSVWCEACNDACSTKLNAAFKDIYNSYDWLKTQIDEIYELCKKLSPKEKQSIKEAFVTNNEIEKLCNGQSVPKYLDELPDVVKDKMKPLLVDFYETLLERKKVHGTKQDYYQKLIDENDMRFCPCCGLSYFESEDSKYREAFDHYLPKAHYPFLSVNFKNLVPLCHKCNSDRKKEKDPIENKKTAFYPFSNNSHSIQISFIIDKTKDLGNLKRQDLQINLIGDTEKIETWDRLFDIKERYNNTTRGFIKTHLNKIKRRHKIFSERKATWTYENSLNELIKDYENDKYEDMKFLKIPFMEELKNCSQLIDVYGTT
jgi:hypothetical protein